MTSNRALVPAEGNPANHERTAPEGPTMAPRRPRLLVPSLFVLGLAALSYVAGAAVMFFELPTARFLGHAFTGARAWNERREPIPPTEQPVTPSAWIDIDQPAKTFDGFTLYACVSLTESRSQAFLVDMHRKEVHRWSVRFSEVWPDPKHLSGRISDGLVCMFSCHLYPNGDLLAVFHGKQRWTNGYGLARLDKDSRVVWSYPAHIHHDVDVAEDGTIYAIRHDIVERMPPGLETIPTPCLVDSLVVLSPDGKERRKPISLLEALRNSPYALLLSQAAMPVLLPVPPTSTVRRTLEGNPHADVMHTNCVRVLRKDMAARFPQFKAGQVLVSMRELDALVVLDPQSGAVVWAARGPWRRQHDPQFLDNGRLLIFDNLGSPRGSRVLEYDPQTQALPWSFDGTAATPLFTSERGMSQRLPNGNTLVVSSEQCAILEVTPAKEIVWSCTPGNYVTAARRFAPDQLPFLKGGRHAARP